MMRNFIKGFFVTAGLCTLAACMTVPVSGRKAFNIVPESIETSLGKQSYASTLSGHPISGDHRLNEIVTRVGQRIAAVADKPDYEWEFKVIDESIQNAFCLPGGKMAVYTGLVPVAQSADAMAIVMGHEISHALLRHGAQRMTEQKLAQIGQMAGAMSGMDPQQMQAVMSVYGYGRALPYARKQESQADEMGLMLAAAACYDPNAAIPLWQRMEQASGGSGQPEFASTHPDPGTRIERLQALMPKALQYRARFCTASGTAQAGAQ